MPGEQTGCIEVTFPRALLVELERIVLETEVARGKLQRLFEDRLGLRGAITLRVIIEHEQLIADDPVVVFLRNRYPWLADVEATHAG